MLLAITEVLDSSTLTGILHLLQSMPLRDGRLSAGSFAGSVKNNREADPEHPQLDLLNRKVLLPLYRHSQFQAAVLPRRLSGAFFAQYTEGMAYGHHVDDPIMGPEGARYRSDVSITVFLNSPAEYDGGELLIDTAFGSQSVKLEAGDAILYPASSLHQVTPVTRGERWVAVAWAESMVRDPAQREMLYDLSLVEQALRSAADSSQDTVARLHRVQANLLRRWAVV